MNIGYKSAKKATAVKIGVWVQPHPDPAAANIGHVVEIALYERPEDECRPTFVIDRGRDPITNEEKTQDIPFEDPILGAGWVCCGCGDHFGKQRRLRRNLYVSEIAAAYVTDDPDFHQTKGIMYFCDDAYSCSKRAVERIGSDAEKQVIRAERRRIANALGHELSDVKAEEEHPGKGLRLRELPPRECRLQSCKKTFTPDTRTSAYCSKDCRATSENSRRESRDKRDKRASRGRPPKAKQTVEA